MKRRDIPLHWSNDQLFTLVKSGVVQSDLATAKCDNAEGAARPGTTDAPERDATHESHLQRSFDAMPLSRGTAPGYR